MLSCVELRWKLIILGPAQLRHMCSLKRTFSWCMTNLQNHTKGSKPLDVLADLRKIVWTKPCFYFYVLAEILNFYLQNWYFSAFVKKGGKYGYSIYCLPF